MKGARKERERERRRGLYLIFKCDSELGSPSEQLSLFRDSERL